uniref:SHSP domain-containing protein n=1 Tax=Psilocybe cubensis TaxID=181762 RepID=A0A8H7XMM8_PSICU
MSFPPSYGNDQYADIYGAGSPSTPNQQQPPGAYPQWETLESTQAQAHEMHSLQSSHHSTPMHTPIATSFPSVELEEPPYLVPSQSHLSQTGSPMSDAPVLLHHPHTAQLQAQQYLQQQPRYDLVQPQEQQQSVYGQVHHMGPPDSSTLFRAPQQPSGVHRSIPSSRGRAAESHPYYRRASGGAVPSYQSHDSRGGSVESPLTPVVVSPVPSTSGVGVSTPLPSVTPSLPPPVPPQPPSPPAKVTTRRTRSAAKPKTSVRFEAGTKTTSGPAPSTSRVPVTRSSTPGPASPVSSARSTTPIPRSSTRRGTSLARTPPPSQTGTTSTSAAASSVSGPGKASKATRSTLHQTSSSSTSTSSTSLPKPSSAESSSIPPPTASTQAPSSALFHAYASKYLHAAPVSTIRADIEYSMRTHIMTASMEIPGVKAEHIHIRLGTSYHTRTKNVVILALCLPAFSDDADGDEAGGRHKMHGTTLPSTVLRPTDNLDVQMRKEEEEEEEEEGESLPTADSAMHPPTAGGHGVQSAPAASLPSTSSSEPKSIADALWEIHGPYRPGQAMRRLTGTDVGFIGRVANPNVRERHYGAMRRVLRVPSNTELEHISARIENGVLTVQIDCGEPMMFDDSVEIPVHVVS